MRNILRFVIRQCAVHASACALAGVVLGCSSGTSRSELVGSIQESLIDIRSSLGGFEPHVAVDPTNPLNVALAQFVSVQLSTDGGRTFPVTLTMNPPAGFNAGVGGDPVLAYDSQGHLFFSFLLQQNATGAIDVFLQQIDHANGVLVGAPFNVSNAAGRGTAAGSNNDKEWLAIDRFTGSPFVDRKYVIWTDFSTATPDVVVSFSDDGVNWSAAQVLTTPAESFAWPPHIAVAANGDVYAAYHSDAQGEIFLVRSPFDSPTNSGGNFDLTTKTAVFPAGTADITFNVQSGTRVLNQNRSWTQGSAQPYILPDPTNANNVLVIASQDPDPANNGPGFDDMSVAMVRSTNRGANWTNPVRIDHDPDNAHQLFPTGAFDLNSQCVSVAYYDSRRNLVNAANDFLLDVLVMTSSDGGQTWGPEVRINDNSFDPDELAGDRFPPTRTLRIGEYIGLTMARGVAWTGNDPLAPAGNQPQRILFDFSDGTPPVVTPPPPAVVGTCRPTEADLGVATATDVCGRPPLSVPTSNVAAILPLTIGNNTVTWSAQDGADNVGTATQLVTVQDTTGPSFTIVPPDKNTSSCTSVDLGQAFAEDDCGGPVTITNNAPAKFPLGVTIVTWTARDARGNTRTATQQVTVALGDDPSCCPAGTNVILGNSNNNTLNGTNGSDCILGRGGQDTINGNGGNDFISGGDGDDVINGGPGDDMIWGGSGQDVIDGGSGNDTLNGGDGDDTVRGEDGNDVLRGGQGQDLLQGQDGNDQLFGDIGDDNLQGGNGDDVLAGGPGNDHCDGGTGTNEFEQCEFGAPVSCANHVQDGTETAVDCGGGCPACATGSACVSGADCQSNVCSSNICQALPDGLAVVLVVETDWGGGYCVHLEATNTGSTPTINWTASVNTNQSTIYTSWNGSFSGSTGVVNIAPTLPASQVISPGNTDRSIGFCANRRTPGSGLLPFVAGTTATR